MATQAYDTASTAYNMARDALEQQHKTANQITVLEVQVADMGERMRAVQSLSAQTLRDASDTYNAALTVYQQAYALEVPRVDHAHLEESAAKVGREARRIGDEARKLIAENERLLRDAQDRRAQLEDLLGRAQDQQQQVDSQLAEMDGHRKRALDSIKKGDDVLEEATNTLNTLKGKQKQTKLKQTQD
jgi:chromosome segregation ATPase